MLTDGELLCVVLTVTHIRHLIPHVQRVYLVGEIRPETIDLLIVNSLISGVWASISDCN